MFVHNGQKLGSVIADAVAEPGEAEDIDPYESATVPELKDMLAERDLPVSGNKAELVGRLREDDEAEPVATDPEDEE